LPVPDGRKLEGQAIKTGVQAWGAYYRLYSGEAFLALDNLSAEANSVMGKINGNASMIGGFVVVGTREIYRPPTMSLRGYPQHPSL